MTIFFRFQSPIFVLMVTLCAANIGCDLGTYAQRAQSSSQSYSAPKVAMPAASKMKKEKNDGPVIAGDWSMDATATANLIQRKVNPLFAGGPESHQKLVEATRKGRMDFQLKADGTFTCHEELGGMTGDFRGNWTIKGDQIVIDQTHHGDKPEKDRLEGTVRGNKMDLKNVSQTVKVPLVLKRR
jgi:hypothetical protein